MPDMLTRHIKEIKEIWMKSDEIFVLVLSRAIYYILFKIHIFILWSR